MAKNTWIDMTTRRAAKNKVVELLGRGWSLREARKLVVEEFGINASTLRNYTQGLVAAVNYEERDQSIVDSIMGGARAVEAARKHKMELAAVYKMIENKYPAFDWEAAKANRAARLKKIRAYQPNISAKIGDKVYIQDSDNIVYDGWE